MSDEIFFTYAEKKTQKKFYLKNLSVTKARFSEDYELKNLRKCELDFGKILKLIEYCLDKVS